MKMTKQEQEKTILRNMGLSDTDILDVQAKSMLYDIERLIIFADSQKVMKTRWEAFKSLLLLVNGVDLDEIEKKFSELKPIQTMGFDETFKNNAGKPPIVFDLISKNKGMSDDEIIREIQQLKWFIENYPDNPKEDVPQWLMRMLDYLGVHADAFRQGKPK